MANIIKNYFLMTLMKMLTAGSHNSNSWNLWNRSNTHYSSQPSYYSYVTYQSVQMQMDEPLTVEMCRNEQYRHLRSCKRVMSRRRSLQSLSQRYFCELKDRWYETTADRRRRQRARRNKRATNQCGGSKTKKIILQAYEADNPTVLRELLHDPENHLYQTLFVENCQNRPPINGYHCRMHQIKFKAAVWSLDPNSNKIYVKDVVTDGYCALSRLD